MKALCHVKTRIISEEHGLMLTADLGQLISQLASSNYLTTKLNLDKNDFVTDTGYFSVNALKQEVLNITSSLKLNQFNEGFFKSTELLLRKYL